uniref:J domain-containing protein n=1 Tax=Alexandrium monilatum TaxID=311494 RepID=A0A7S4RF69_9DINO|mmetsp:Transcript_103054/g.327610  ORF Transcript_103054/g.327610 Transcript_103054/m.327610 type:complete len:366 (+) Transcript_103054:38-1135(+)
MAGDELDAAFADFLKEVGDDPTPSGKPVGAPTDCGEGAGEAAPRQSKRARQSKDSRFEQAKELRKAAYQGKQVEVESLLAGLPVGERLLLIDDLDPEDGFAAIHLAVIQGHVPVARTLLGRRADVDALTRDGDTPLMWAAHSGNAAVCKALLDFGADASIKKMMKTAAMQAKAAGHRRIQEMLDNHAFDVAAGLRRNAMSKEKAAAARRAANAALLAETIRQAEEKAEDEAFWAGIRARREGREASGEDADLATRRAYSAAKAEEAKAEAAKAAEEAALLASLPARMQPHYRILELPPDATEAEVRRGYKLFALKHHPDKNPKDPVGAKERFTRGAVAYEAVCEYLASLEKSGGGGIRVAPPSCY